MTENLAWLRAFVLTCALEIPVVIVCTRSSVLTAVQRSVLALFAQLATHPIAWFVLMGLPWSIHRRITISELWAVGVEAIFYLVAFGGLPKRVALLTSILANGLSFGTGLVLYAIGWLE